MSRKWKWFGLSNPKADLTIRTLYGQVDVTHSKSRGWRITSHAPGKLTVVGEYFSKRVDAQASAEQFMERREIALQKQIDDSYKHVEVDWRPAHSIPEDDLADVHGRWWVP